MFNYLHFAIVSNLIENREGKYDLKCIEIQIISPIINATY